MNEAETRTELIDPALKAAGWGVVEGSRVQREYKITQRRIEGGGRRGTPEIADYIPVYRNIKLGVVGAIRDLIDVLAHVAWVWNTDRQSFHESFARAGT